MKYISIDIETSGLDFEKNQILSIGAIIEDTEKKLPFEELPKFHVGILRQDITGSLFAINMNRDLIETLVEYQTAKSQDEKNDIVHMTGMQFLKEEDVVEAFHDFLYENGLASVSSLDTPMKVINGKSYPILTSRMTPAHINVAGKNFGTFDKLFLERLPRWKQAIRIRQRIIDPGVYFIYWKDDDSVPSLDLCKERAGLKGKVTHNALEDAWDVIELLRKQY